MSRPVQPPLDFRVEAAGPLSEQIARRIGRSAEDAIALMRFGAVYVNRDRVREELPLREGDYVRVHREPRRYPADGIDWNARLVLVTDDFVVVDKPSGLPVHPTCDNAVENVIAEVTRHLGSPLFIVQRLDVATRGLMVLARTQAYCRRFNDAMEHRRVRKWYRAVVETPVSVGELTHYMMPADRAPRVLAPDEREGWKMCRLVVDSCRPLEAGRFLVEMQLLTGRMHQIRAQLSAMGAPIVGDALYGSRARIEGNGETIALQSCRLVFPGRSDDIDVALASPF